MREGIPIASFPWSILGKRKNLAYVSSSSFHPFVYTSIRTLFFHLFFFFASSTCRFFQLLEYFSSVHFSVLSSFVWLSFLLASNPLSLHPFLHTCSASCLLSFAYSTVHVSSSISCHYDHCRRRSQVAKQ